MTSMRLTYEIDGRSGSARILEYMRFDDFFQQVHDPDSGWGAAEEGKRVLNMELVDHLAKEPIVGDNDLDSAIGLTRAIRGEYESYGTNEAQVTITNEQSHDALRSLRLVLLRHGVRFRPPWIDFTSFKEYWLAHDGYGSWQARRAMIGKVFEPILEQLEQLQEREITNELTRPVSPRDALGWPMVDEYIQQLRERFRSALSVADYKDVGNRCVGVLEALSATVYDPKTDCPEGSTPPPVDKTDIRIGAYIDRRLPGASNQELRGLVKKASALAHKMKHSPRADRTSTGIVADSVILLANILRRLQEAGRS